MAAEQIINSANTPYLQQIQQARKKYKSALSSYSPRENSTSANVNLSSNSLKSTLSNYDITNSTPAQMAALSQELYENGVISFQQHTFLSFQPELSPSYSEVFGKEPDLESGKNYIEVWENKLDLQQKYGAPSDQISQTEEILNILRSLDAIQ